MPLRTPKRGDCTKGIDTVSTRVRDALPRCFGSPAHCSECFNCLVRTECYEINSEQDVYMIPRERSVKIEKRTPGAKYVKEN